MNKRKRILLLLISVCTLGSGYAFHQTQTTNELCKKWRLDKYSYWFYTESPKASEMSDFIHFKEDFSYESISEGQYDSGRWELDVDQKRVRLHSYQQEEELVFLINTLNDNELILIIDDQSDSELAYLKIHFKYLKS